MNKFSTKKLLLVSVLYFIVEVLCVVSLFNYEENFSQTEQMYSFDSFSYSELISYFVFKYLVNFPFGLINYFTNKFLLTGFIFGLLNSLYFSNFKYWNEYLNLNSQKKRK